MYCTVRTCTGPPPLARRWPTRLSPPRFRPLWTARPSPPSTTPQARSCRVYPATPTPCHLNVALPQHLPLESGMMTQIGYQRRDAANLDQILRIGHVLR